MIWLAAALADPGAFRGPDVPVSIQVGAPSSSLAIQSGRWTVGGWGRLDGGSIGAAVGTDVKSGGFRVDLWGGALVSLASPGGGVHLGAAAGLARQNDRMGGHLQLVLPASMGLAPRLEWRLPLLVEGAVHRRFGKVWLGGRGAVGAILGPRRLSPSIQGGFDIGIGGVAR